MKHYIKIENGLPVEVSRRLPSSLTHLEDGTVCWTPAAVEAQGRLHEYGWIAFDSADPTNRYESPKPLTVADMAWDGDAEAWTAIHRFDQVPLESARARRKAEIDASTGTLISQGFPFAGTTFPLDDVMQTNLIGAMTMLGVSPSAVASLPPWGNIDDTETATFATVEEFAAFFAAAFQQVATHRATGRALKTQIDNAATPAEVLAVVDPRTPQGDDLP